MDEYRVPQRKIAVEVVLVGGRAISGDAYAPAAGPGGEPGRLLDRLNERGERFLPVTGGSGGVLIRKGSIVAVRLGSEDAARENHTEEHQREVAVSVTLEEGPALEGRVAYTLPPERSRLLDYFNAAHRFIALLDREGATLINTERVVEVARLDDPDSRD